MSAIDEGKRSGPPDAARVLQAHELYASYAHAADEGRLKYWAGLFAENSTFTINGEEFQGPDGAYEFITRHRSEGERSGSLHAIFNVTVHVDGDRALGRADFVRFSYEGPTLQALAVGLYRSELIWIDGRWQFMKHDTEGHWPR